MSIETPESPVNEEVDRGGPAGRLTGPFRGSDASLHRWAAGIGVIAVATFAWMISLGRWQLLRSGPFTEMLDIQARSIMSGHLWVPEGSLAFEAFVVDGQHYAYFGVFPSLLRVPLFAVTDRFDGRLSTLSMLVAYLVAYVAVVRMVGRVHALVRPGRAWSRGGLAVALLTIATAALGSNLLYLGSSPWVYHEASLWGVAGALASLAAICAWLGDPRARHVLVAGIWAGVAWTSRGSVGLAPSVALGLLAIAVLLDHRVIRAVAPVPATARRGLRAAAPLAAAALLGGLAFAAVNVAKFGSPTALPLDAQVLSTLNPPPSRQAALDAYGGTLFTAQVAPAIAVQTLRPDLLRPTATWPFVDFTRKHPPMLGAPVFDTVEPSSGLTLTHPLLLVLAAVGAVAVFSPRGEPSRPIRPRDPPDLSDLPDPPGGGTTVGAAGLRPLVLGGVLGAGAVFSIAFIAQRYLTDLLPLLFVLAAAGVAVLDRWFAGSSRRGTRGRLLLGGLTVLTAVGISITLATTWLFQRFTIPPDAEATAAALRTQVTVAGTVGRPPSFERAASIDDVKATADVLLVVGDCAGLYVGQDDGVWTAIEVAADAGVQRVEVLRPPVEAGDAVEIGRVGHLLVELVADDGDRLRVDVVRPDGSRSEGDSFNRTDGPLLLDIDLDGNLPLLEVLHRNRVVYFSPGSPPSRQLSLVDDDTVVAHPIPTPTCDAIIGH